jgi:hypothetical protein
MKECSGSGAGSKKPRLTPSDELNVKVEVATATDVTVKLADGYRDRVHPLQGGEDPAFPANRGVARKWLGWELRSRKLTKCGGDNSWPDLPKLVDDKQEPLFPGKKSISELKWGNLHYENNDFWQAYCRWYPTAAGGSAAQGLAVTANAVHLAFDTAVVASVGERDANDAEFVMGKMVPTDELAASQLQSSGGYSAISPGEVAANGFAGGVDEVVTDFMEGSGLGNIECDWMHGGSGGTAASKSFPSRALEHHLIDWSTQDVLRWALREFPASRNLVGALKASNVDGSRLWYIDEPTASTLCNGLTEREKEHFWRSLKRLKVQSELATLRSAAMLHLHDLEETKADPNFKLAAELAQQDMVSICSTVRDFAYSKLISRKQFLDEQQFEADTVLAERLQKEAQEQGTSLRLANDFEQLRVDGELARRVSTKGNNDRHIREAVHAHGQNLQPESVALGADISSLREACVKLRYSPCLPGCVNPSLGLHHLKCPNFGGDTERSPSIHSTFTTDSSIIPDFFAETASVFFASLGSANDIQTQQLTSNENDANCNTTASNDDENGGAWQLTRPVKQTNDLATGLKVPSMEQVKRGGETTVKVGEKGGEEREQLSAVSAASYDGEEEETKTEEVSAPYGYDGKEEEEDGEVVKEEEILICDVCAGSLPNIVDLECEHKYCVPCLTKMFQQALCDLTLLPVRCCKKLLDLSIAPRVLAPAQVAKLMQFLEERDCTNKMYCPNKPCSVFINLDELDFTTPNLVLHCPSCAWRLCANCKTAEHPESTCDGNSAALDDGVLADVATTEGWKKCQNCQVWVSLSHGCSHMTCVCGFHFCYECGARWKNCDCKLWVEEQLLRERERRVENQEQHVGRHLNAWEHEQVAQQLNADNENFFECEHDHLYERDFRRTRTAGGYQRECSNCEHCIPVYAFECSDCQERFCKVCAHDMRHRRR